MGFIKLYMELEKKPTRYQKYIVCFSQMTHRVFSWMSSIYSRVSNIESDNSQNVGLEDYNNIYVGIFQWILPPL